MRQQQRNPQNKHNILTDSKTFSGFHYKENNFEDLQSLNTLSSTSSSDSLSSANRNDVEFVKLKASKLCGHQWNSILDELTTQVQMRRKLLPLPTSANGVTYVGGNISFEANRISLACMNGEMNASRYF